MVIDIKKIFLEDLEFLKYDVHKSHFLLNEKEHYRLLTYITKQYNDIIILDLGTADGYSCISLAQNIKNKIITYDILDKKLPFIDEYKNVAFKKLDANEESEDIIKSAKIILLDIDPHDGLQEQKFIDLLERINYKGYVICDDIHLNEPMQKWWNNIKFEKYDLTNVGHWSGTGLINFYNDDNVTII